jgi:hypothetical protein
VTMAGRFKPRSLSTVYIPFQCRSLMSVCEICLTDAVNRRGGRIAPVWPLLIPI